MRRETTNALPISFPLNCLSTVHNRFQHKYRNGSVLQLYSVRMAWAAIMVCMQVKCNLHTGDMSTVHSGFYKLRIDMNNLMNFVHIHSTKSSEAFSTIVTRVSLL
jgi:hypothetical protein